MKIGISGRDSKRMILAKLPLLVFLMPLVLLYCLVMYGVSEAIGMLRRFPSEVQSVRAWYQRAKW